jgi:GTPase
LIVFNKIDQVDEETIANATLEFPRSVFIAAAERTGLETLRYRISQLLS